MGKNELITNISKITGVEKDICESVLDGFASEVTLALTRGEKVMMKGFMSFEVGVRNERDARNPRTGEVEHFPAVKTIKCRMGKRVKEAVNGRIGDDLDGLID